MEQMYIYILAISPRLTVILVQGMYSTMRVRWVLSIVIGGRKHGMAASNIQKLLQGRQLESDTECHNFLKSYYL